MLSIGKMGKAGDDVASYYVSLAREDYYTQGGEPPGQWRGIGSSQLGLNGSIDAADLRPVLAGYDPHTATGLVQHPGPTHVAGWDLTFSAPKSVSVLWSQADPETRQVIQAAQQTAVDRALDFVEAHAAFTRRGSGSKIQEPVAGLVVACYEHSTSRAQDPQLHTHCLVANAAPRRDGTWGSVDSRHLFAWKMASGAVYRSELAHTLQNELGWGIARDERSFRVVGVPENVEKHFAQRSTEIQERLHHLGLEGPRAAASVTLDSRAAKDEINRSALFARWQQEGAALQFGPQAVAELLAEPPQSDALPVPGPETVLASLTETASTFTTRDVWRCAAEASQGIWDTSGINDLVAELWTHPDCVYVGDDRRGQARFSSEEMVELERRLLTQALDRKEEPGHCLPKTTVDTVLTRRTLSPEQETAVRHLTEQLGGVSCMVGMAGTGKSYALDAARAAWESHGFQVVGTALSGKAAQGLQASAKIPSTTLHALLQRLDSGESPLAPHTVLVVDEAGMVGSRQLARVLDHAETASAKVVLVGDPGQLQPIDAGGAFRLLVDNLGAPHLTDIQRQHAPWARQAVHDVAGGRALEALQAYHQRGCLTVASDRPTTIQDMTNRWLEYRQIQPDKSVLMLAATHDDTQKLNNTVRDGLKAQQSLVGSVNLKIHNGMREFAAGDRVLFTRNGPLYGVRNGSLGTVERLREDGFQAATLHVRLDDGRLTSVHSSDFPYLEHGYALTTHKAQGVTVDQAFILTGGAMTDRELSTVQLSRHRDGAALFVDRGGLEEALREAEPTPAMVRYAEDVAAQQGIALPKDHDRNFLSCRDFLNRHGERDINTKDSGTLQELYALARPMSVSHAKDTTLDYQEPVETRTKAWDLER